MQGKRFAISNMAVRQRNENILEEEFLIHRKVKDSAKSNKDDQILNGGTTMLLGLQYLLVVLISSLLIGGTDALKSPDSIVKLDKEDLKFLFGDKEPPPHSVITIRSRSREKRSSDSLTEDPGLLDVILEDETDQIEFELRPNIGLVSPDFVLVVRGEDGVTRERGITRPSCVFMGTAKGRPETTAALSNCDGHGFTGVIVDKDHTHLVKPLENNDLRRRRRRQVLDEKDKDFTPDGLHVIHTKDKHPKCAVFNLQAMKAPRYIVRLPENFTEFAVNVTSEENNGKHERKKRASKDRLQIETAVFVDDEMYDVIQKRNPSADVVETVTNVVFAIMNGVHLLYNAPSLDIHFTITLVRLDIIKSSTKGPSKGGGDIQRYLSNFCYWQRNLNKVENPGGDKTPGFWDHALMLSGMDLWDGTPEMDSVIGLAWVAGMCHPTYSCTINEGTSFEAVYVITHEMGHNLGMSHDGSVDDKNDCDPETYIMSPSTGPGKVTWSKCSNRELKNFLDSSEYSVSCLDDLKRGPKELDFSDEMLPGEIYTVNQQCTYALGSTFKPYVTSKFPYNNVCRETWCQNTTHAMRTHPALEGTSCGVKKFCVNGQCVDKPANAMESATTQETTLRNRTAATTSTTTTTTTSSPTRKGFGDFFKRIRNLFSRYLFLRHDIPSHVFVSKWSLQNQTQCSAPCGGGWQESLVACSSFDHQVIVDDDLCDPLAKPPSKAACNTHPCVEAAPSTPGISFNRKIFPGE